MKNTTKRIYNAVLELAANTPELKEAMQIVELLAQYHVGYQKTWYEWLGTTKSHSFCVEFSGRLPIVAIHPDMSTAIVLINQRIMNAFKQRETDLSNPIPTALECLEVRDNAGEVVTEAFLSANETSDLRTEFAA